MTFESNSASRKTFESINLEEKNRQSFKFRVQGLEEDQILRILFENDYFRNAMIDMHVSKELLPMRDRRNF